MNALRNTYSVAVLVLALGFTHQAQAGLEVNVSDGVNTGTANDSGTPGTASFSGTIATSAC